MSDSQRDSRAGAGAGGGAGPFLLGVDGGGSKTVAVVVRADGTVIGSGHGGCGNYQMVGVDAAVTEIGAAVDGALRASGLQAGDIDYAEYALAGADRPADDAVLRPALAGLPVARWDLVCDTLAGLRLGSPDATGVVLVCGSGTNAFGRDATGREVQIGGFGWHYGDAAGGHMLAAFALRAAVRSWEGREIRSLLADQVPAEFGYPDMAALIADLAGRDPWLAHAPALDSLPRLVHTCASAGDELCIRLLRDMGRELGLAASAVLRRLDWTGDGAGGGESEKRSGGGTTPVVTARSEQARSPGASAAGTVPVVLIGSVVQRGRSPHLTEALAAELARSPVRTRMVIPDLDPVFGAVLLAMDHAGVPAPVSPWPQARPATVR